MTRTLVITTFAAAAIAGALVSAQQAQQRAEQRGNIDRRPLIAALDTNHDATISTEELAAATTSLLALDANHDGQLSLDEVRPAGGRGGRADGRAGPGRGNRDGQDGQNGQDSRAQADAARRGRGGPRGNAIVGVLDANGDRTLSAEEIAAAPEALKTLDRNADGQLTREELGPAFGRRGGPPRSTQAAV
jgi:Ca2+-binding EF-hand superfamily protein